ncbi:MAG: elongation factor G [Gammaproteobacteria bacterium]|jgi:elongation factor G|nr:elongation factor G [Gammaproteobacteria bacterium]
MANYTTADIRNLALVGNGGSGKTSLVEALLHAAGAIGSQGDIGRGTMVCDHEPEEKTHGHSLTSAVAHCDIEGVHANLIDTPGYPDFVGHALGALEAVETAAVVIDAQTGIDQVTRRMLERAGRRKLCRIIIVNKIDGEHTDLPGLLTQLQEEFGSECLPINLPAEGGSRVVDCFFNPSGDADFSSVAEAHEALIDQVVEVDEKLMELYLEQGEELAAEQLHDPFEQALRESHLVPVCFVSARTGAGVRELLDIIVKLMPNPMEGNPPPFYIGEEDPREFHAEPDQDKHVLAHVFKVTSDPYAGKLGIFRIYQGMLTRETQLYVGDARKAFKVGHLFNLQGKEHVEIERGIPGDICAVAKVEEVHFHDVLHDAQEDGHVHLKPMNFPEPMLGLAIEPKNRSDDQKVAKALAALTSEDPTLVVERTTATNETVLRGIGDLHLRVVLEKMANRYNAEVETHPPSIAYRETVTAKAEGHHRHKKQTGGAGQFGEVYLRIEPLPRGSGFEFHDKIVGGVIPGQFIPAVEKGVRQVLEQGAIAGFPMQDVSVTVYDGKHHPVDSKEIAFVTAAKKAFQDAVGKARPVLLEPVVSVTITCPDSAMGDVSGDLSSKRAQISGTDTKSGGMLVITGKVPLSELNGYQSRLKGITGGQGSFAMEFSHYEPLPMNLQQEIVAQHKPKESEE